MAGTESGTISAPWMNKCRLPSIKYSQIGPHIILYCYRPSSPGKQSQICKQEVYCECSLDQHLWESAGSRTVQVEPLGCDVVLSEDSANPMGELWSWESSSDRFWILKRGEIFMLLNLPVFGCGLSSHLRPAVSSAEGDAEKKDPSYGPSTINTPGSQ